MMDGEELAELIEESRGGDDRRADTRSAVNAALIRLMWESHRSLDRKVNGLYVLIIASVGALATYVVGG